MTIVEAYVGGEKIDPPEDVSLMSSTASSLLIEGIAQNTTGSVFEPEVNESFYLNFSNHNLVYYIWDQGEDEVLLDQYAFFVFSLF